MDLDFMSLSVGLICAARKFEAFVNWEVGGRRDVHKQNKSYSD